MSELNVVQLNYSNFRDPVATLRKIADEIERGDFGPVGCVGIVICGNTTEVFGAGVDSEAPSVAVLLYAGFMRMAGFVESHGKE